MTKSDAAIHKRVFITLHLRELGSTSRACTRKEPIETSSHEGLRTCEIIRVRRICAYLQNRFLKLRANGLLPKYTTFLTAFRLGTPY